jgi:hypothetical protein
VAGGLRILFGDRYEARPLRTPDEVREALADVVEDALFTGTQATLVAPRSWLTKSEDVGRR